jgi:hypothetical protein
MKNKIYKKVNNLWTIVNIYICRLFTKSKNTQNEYVEVNDWNEKWNSDSK